MIRSFDAGIFGAILIRSVTGQDSGDIEQDGRFLKCERVLRRRLGGKCVEPSSDVEPASASGVPRRQCAAYLPGERYLDVILIHGKTEIQELKLSIISI